MDEQRDELIVATLRRLLWELPPPRTNKEIIQRMRIAVFPQGERLRDYYAELERRGLIDES